MPVAVHIQDTMPFLSEPNRYPLFRVQFNHLTAVRSNICHERNIMLLLHGMRHGYAIFMIHRLNRYPMRILFRFG